MEPNQPGTNAASASSTLPPFTVVDDGRGAVRSEPLSDYGAGGVGREGETPDERKKRLKSERDKRYYESKRKGTASPGGQDAKRDAGGRPTDARASDPANGSPVDDAINSLKGQFQQTPPPPGTAAAPGMGTTFVATGALLLGVMNATTPGLVAKFASRDRVTPIDAERVALTPKQMELLKPAAAPAEAYLIQNAHPLVVFSLSFLSAIMSNIPPKTEADKAAAKEVRAKRATRAK